MPGHLLLQPVIPSGLHVSLLTAGFKVENENGLATIWLVRSQADDVGPESQFELRLGDPGYDHKLSTITR
jgi:hypothetical protein